MRAALGLVPLSGGAISVLGRPATRGNGAVGYVPQNRGAFAGLRLTGYDIVASAAGGAGWGCRARRGDAPRDRLGAGDGRCAGTCAALA